jgi:hypothetical protein
MGPFLDLAFDDEDEVPLAQHIAALNVPFLSSTGSG